MHGSPVSANLASVGETFAALDAEAPEGRLTWTHTGANRAEASFEDPALGMVGVRADLSGGSVHASLVAGSTDAAQMLGSHLAGLNNYLAERHPSISPVTVAGQENDGTLDNSHAGSDAEAGRQSGSQSQGQQESAGNSNGNSYDAGSGVNANSAVLRGIGRAESLSSNASLPAASATIEPTSRSRGSHISLMA
jgi:hypothetical protein